MRVPTVRFFGDDRPIEPWEERAAPFVMPFVLPLLLAVVLLVSAFGVLSLLAWGAVSPVLPRSWRLDWNTAFELDPSVHPECPTCKSRLALGPVDKRGHAFRTDTGRVLVLPAQTAECPACQRSFSRVSFGKVWSSWAERKDAETLSWPTDLRKNEDPGTA